MSLSNQEIKSICKGHIYDPHHLLGIHTLGDGKGVAVRCWDPPAQKLNLTRLDTSETYSMEPIEPSGLFELVLPDVAEPFKYSFHSEYKGGARTWIDPYSFLPTVQNKDLVAFNEGWDRRPFEKLGAIPRFSNQTDGVSFVVWAPSAKAVHLIGDFNHWNILSLPMRNLGSSGCWELFVPSARVGDKYKFRVLGADEKLREKTDPFGWRFESLPGNAAIICERLKERKSSLLSTGISNRETALSIYEMHLGSWRYDPESGEPLSYLELASHLPQYVKSLGFTHVEFLPLSEYPFGASWGYQVTGYYAPTHRFGSPEDFAVLVESLQNSGIGVIMDWVPAHFPADEFALARFDGTCLFEHEDPRKGMHAEWGTLCFNYGRAEVRSFLIGSAVAWLDRFGIDGYRVDAVASMLYLDYARKDGEWCPNIYGGNENLEAIDFLKQFNHSIHEEHSNVISIAEESTSFPQITNPPYTGGLGFDHKWNMGWMHDVLGYFSTDPIYRKYKHNQLTFGAMYQFTENFVQAFSHDEVVHGKGSLVNKMNLAHQEDRIANLRALFALQWLWPGKKTLFMGCEFGQWTEWDFENQLDWALLDFPNHQGLKQLIADLNKLYIEHSTWAAVDHQSDKFRWIDCNDEDGQTLSFLKFGHYPADTLLIACNFSDHLQHRNWGCPHAGTWEVLLDSDSPAYAGQGAGGGTTFSTMNQSCNDQPYSLSLSVNRWSVQVLAMTSEA